MLPEADVLTVVFTDLVDSTRLLTDLGDEAGDEVRRTHFSLLRRAISDHQGKEIKSVGDGLMVAFPSARSAVACAAAMQQAVSTQPEQPGLRVGIDAGEPIHDRGDLYGTSVVVAKRLCDVAEGGQILVSDLVRMLSGSRLSVPLEQLGPLELKGIGDPVVTYRVRWRASNPAVRLCGGLVVEQDGERLDERLPSRQARMLFALLVLERDHALSRASIADALWPDVAPPSRDNSIRALLTGVRRVFGPESIDGHDGVRLLLPDNATVDVDDAQAAVDRAADALERGDPREAGRAARRAAALTGDELLTGLSAPWIDERRDWVEELWLRASEIEAQAALQAGSPADAERAARRIVERAPFRESAHALLMEALAAGGNVAEATLAYDRLRTQLRDELGTAPAPAVVALHDRLLAGDSPTATPAPHVGEPAPPGRGSVPPAAEQPRAYVQPPLPAALARAGARPFVARAAELDQLRGAWAAALNREGRLVLLGGEPGIGKTTLAARFAGEAHDDGATVVLGRCHPEALVPYEPFVEALRQLPDDVLREHGAHLARVMPELAPEGASPAAGDDAASRYLLFDAVSRALGTAAGATPIVFVLDDLHWADPPTLLLLRHVARASEQGRLLLMATYRTTEVTGTTQVVQAIADLARELPVERVTLEGLDNDEVSEMIRAIEGRPASAPLGTVMRRDTAGNPLFVTQLLRHLEGIDALVERDGQLRLTAGDKPLGVPESAKELVAARLAGLEPEVVATLRTAAVIGRSFDHELVMAVQDRSGDEVLDALEAGVAAGLVEDTDTGSQAFVHALVREAIYEGTSASRRRAAHRRVAEELEASGSADPAAMAHHFLAAGDRPKGLEHSVASAKRALGQLAYEDATTHYRHALDALGADDPARRCDLLIALGDAQAREGDTPSAKRTYREAAELAEQLDLPEQLARAAIGYGGRLLWEVSRDDDYLVPLLERALAAIGSADSPLRVRLLARLGGGPLRDAHDPTRRRTITGEALDAARRLDDPATLAWALDGYISAHHSPDHTAKQVELATELIEVATTIGDLERAIEAYEHRAAGRMELGDLAGAAADVDAMAPLVADLRQPAQEWFLAERRAVQALDEGRLVQAEELIEDALRIGRDALPWSAAVCHMLQLVVLRGLQGRLAEVEPAARAASEDYAKTYPPCRCAHLQVLAAIGHDDEARAGVAALAPDRFAALKFDETWLAAVAFLSQATHALGEADHAEALYDLLAPYSERVAVCTPEVALGSVSRYLGLLAATCGRPGDAAAHLEQAVAHNSRIGARPWAALSLEDLAALTGDRETAGRAVEAYRELGMDGLG